MTRNILSLTLLLTIALLLGGCHTQKPARGASGNIPSLPESAAPTAQLFEQLTGTYDTWTDLYVPVTLRLESPKPMSVSGRATMVNGKEIYISLRVLGMELGVIYINESKMYAVDKIHKQYVEQDLGSLLSGVDVTISDVQSILLGRITSFGKGTITAADADDFEFLSADNDWILTPVKQFKGTELNYIATKTDPPVLKDISLRTVKSVLDCSYTDMTDTPAGAVASTLNMLTSLNKTDVRASIEWNMKEAKWNEGRTANFKTPQASYKKIDIRTLFNSISRI